ncbi:nuclease-related domain-containing protein [Neobacillus sp. Marseille-QA0830]
MPEIKNSIRVLRSGYNGEKVLNYYLKLLPEEQYYIFHDLRLPNQGNSFFQIDALLLSKRNIIILDGKNHSGSLKIERNQMIQTFNDKREIYENPLDQGMRHKILLRYFFDRYVIPFVPIEYYVVITKSSTEIMIDKGYTEAKEKVCKATDLLRKIWENEKSYKKDIINQGVIERISQTLIDHHNPKRLDVLTTFGIGNPEIITGVQCPKCLSIPMIYNRKIWICPICHYISRDAFLKAINDYFLVINPFFSNPELRDFLHLPSSRTTTKYIHELNLPYTGVNRGRIYHQPTTLILP